MRLEELLELARLGPVVPVAVGAKRPRTRHGVHDATSDPAKLARWLRRWPDTNWAIATGAPGPTVIDLDAPRRVPELVGRLDALGGPCVATARGLHYYCRGEERATFAIEHGEVRGRGSYVVCPPSMHPSGRVYVWLHGPDVPLPAVPVALVNRARTLGTGELAVPGRPLREGEGRHRYMVDTAVRLVRAGMVDAERLEAHLRLEFELSCAAEPAPRAGFFQSVAVWAASSRIAERERAPAATDWWKGAT
jgi:hypothetical protein